jgi:hypothetical protein
VRSNRTAGSLKELEQLEALVAEGRRKRLEAVPELSPVAESRNSPTG